MSEQVYISEAHLKGYKSILDTQVTFKPGLNIIIGKNGSGKTNLVEYIKSLLNFHTDSYTEIDSSIKLVKSDKNFVLNYHKKKTISSESVSVGKTNIIFRNNEEEGVEIENEFELYKISDSFITPVLLSYSLPLNFSLLSTSLSFVLENSFPEEIFTKVTRESLSYFSKSLLSSLFMELTGTKEVNDKSIIERVINFQLDNIRHSIQNYTPVKDIRLSPDIRVQVGKEQVSFTNIYFEFLINNDWFTFEQLSDGTKRVIILVSEISTKTKYGWGHSFIGIGNDENAIFFLEEPELGIHPHQLHQLMNFIKEEAEEKQIILTTHSPQVLNVLSAEELDRILICEWTSEKGTQLRHMTEKETEDAKVYMKEVGYLSDYWLHSGFNTL